MQQHNILFTPIDIHGMALKNRLVRSATYDALATEDGHVTDEMIRLYTQLAEGGVGLIISGGTYVQANGVCLPLQGGIARDDQISGLQTLVAAVHEAGAKFALQLIHAGRQTLPGLIGGQTPLAPSAIEADPMFYTTPRAMTEAEILDTITAFGEAARRAKAAGCDAVQLHVAHGYLLAQFLSPHTNRRTDEWGGKLENRMRFVLAVYDKVRQVVGDTYPILIKLGVAEGVENGITLEDACQVAQKLAQREIDAIEISGGTIVESIFMMSRGDIPLDILTRGKDPEIKKLMEDALYGMRDLVKFEEAYWQQPARQVKAAIGNVPLMLVGGMKYPQTMERLVQEQTADLIALCRPLIREPDLPNEMAAGRKGPVRCAFCNRCLGEVVTPKPLQCYNVA